MADMHETLNEGHITRGHHTDTIKQGSKIFKEKSNTFLSNFIQHYDISWCVTLVGKLPSLITLSILDFI
jgi:hypothetical protein